MDEDDNQNVTDEHVLEPETENQASPDADAVRAYLAEKQLNEARKAAEGANELLEGKVPEEAPKAQDEAPEPQKPKESEDESIHLRVDSAFEDNEMDLLDRRSVQVKVSNVPITESDERAYLKSMLTDTPLELTIDLYGGQIEIVARAVSVYEQQLAAVAAFRYTIDKENAGVASLLAPTFIQKLRIALQLRSCNGILISDLEYKPEPGKFKEHAKDLVDRAEELIGSTTAARWNAYIYALNVFEHKLTTLDEMALNRDFLSPGG